MLERITQENIEDIANPVLRANAQIYLDIDADFRRQIESDSFDPATDL